MTPSVGRIVHYRSYGTPGGEFASVCRAAIITEVIDQWHVSLCAVNPTGLFFNQNVLFDNGEGPQGTGVPGTWHWPERT